MTENDNINNEISQESQENVIQEKVISFESLTDESSLLQLTPSIEALIFSHGEPIQIQKLADLVQVSFDEVIEEIQKIQMRYLENEECGIELVVIGNSESKDGQLDKNKSIQFRTKSKYGELVQSLKEVKPRRLSGAALETLSIIAYRQPVTKSDIDGIRGVEATPVIKTLLDKGLVKISGHLQTPGQPALYSTTDEFFKVFGLTSLSELPTPRDIEELEKEPGEIPSEMLREIIGT